MKWTGSFLGIIILLAMALDSLLAAEFEFVHPGLLQTRADLERMRNAAEARREPIFGGYEVFRANQFSRSNYTLRGPALEIGRNPNVNSSQYDSDANAAFQCAIQWAITGERTYAEKGKAILNAWSATLKAVSGRDAVLMAGLGPFKMVNAAEIIRYTEAGWSDTDIQRAERSFKEVIYPAIEDFAPFANGNWEAAAIRTVMAIGVFCNDSAMFERALRYYVNGAGNGRLTHYIINDSGQCQESGRDQPHTQLGLALLGDCCEIAWNQGLDLYGYADNRLLEGFEYTAKYNLGEDVPFTETLDRTGKYRHRVISTNGRGRLRAVFEQIYHHYVNRAGIPAPWTQKAAERIRPEGPGQPGADHPGFGTLLYSRPPAIGGPLRSGSPASPGAVVALGSPSGIKLNWVASVGAARYAVKRATTSSGAFVTIARNVASPAFTDANVETGKLYYYTVTALNAAGESADAFETGVSAGLPTPWSQLDVGAPAVEGRSQFDGGLFTMEGAGKDIGGTNDQFQLAYAPMNGDGTITARCLPQVSSQFTKMGLMMRDAPTAKAAHVSLLLTPEPTNDVEAPGWKVVLMVRNSPGAPAMTSSATANLHAPFVTHGRLTGHCWLRLERRGNTFTGSYSQDGEVWTTVGSVTNGLKSSVLVGLSTCSRITTVSTTVKFDEVSVQNRNTK